VEQRAEDEVPEFLLARPSPVSEPEPAESAPVASPERTSAIALKTRKRRRYARIDGGPAAETRRQEEPPPSEPAPSPPTEEERRRAAFRH
jgi:hypothetical protein